MAAVTSTAIGASTSMGVGVRPIRLARKRISGG